MILISRRRRVWYPGAIYHVTNRGNRKSKIFEEQEDYQFFLKFVEKANSLYPFHLISYCLMPNHIHLQIETIDHSISQIMHYILSQYAKYFNVKYDFVGHVFQGRFQAEIIKDDIYMLEASRYIHLNPVKAKIVKNPIDFPWSSYSAYMGKKNCNLTQKQRILECLSKNTENTKDLEKLIQSYQKYVEKW